MAKNWKVGEAIVAIKSGNKEDMLDIGRRFPLFAILAAQTNDAGTELLNCVPDYCTARKIESVLKGGVAESDDTEVEDAEEVVEEAPKAKAAPKGKAKAAAKKEAVEDDEDDLEDKSAKELFDMCKKAGIKVEPKKDKSVYIKALKKAEAKAQEAEEDDWGEEDETPKAKPAAKGKAKAKPAKEADDEEDWDI